MVSQARLHDAFGKIIYAVAIADGLIQEEELKLIDEKLTQFSWGEDAKWSEQWLTVNIMALTIKNSPLIL